METFAIKIYGCQMNVYDGDKIRTSLIDRGWREVKDDKAGLVIYVGCSIRAKSESRVWSEIGLYKGRWEETGGPKVCLVGCMAQNVGRKIFRRFPWLRLIAGPRSLGLVPEGLMRVAKGEKVDLIDQDPRTFIDLDVAPIHRVNRWKAYVTIAHGCDNFCTYCIVPHVRGRFMSRDSEDILREVRELVDDGVREIFLLGQNVDTYGADFSRRYRFSDLLRDVAQVKGVGLVRFMTSYPNDFTEDVVKVIAENPVICPSINLPIQSGSDRILRKMNRHYNLADYDKTVNIIREGIPEVGLTSDLIVGFPGETEEDFQDSLAILRKYRFDQVHTAAYSPREGTSAASMEGQIDRAEKSRRLQEVNSLHNSIVKELNSQLVGKVYRILVDDKAQRGEGLLQGRTRTDKVVLFPGDSSLLGKFVTVEIKRANNWSLRGEILEVED